VQFVDNQGYAARFLDQDSDPALAHLTASGNGTDAVGVGGIGTPLEGLHTWEVMGLPYIANGLMTVGMDGQLVVEPGVEVASPIMPGWMLKASYLPWARLTSLLPLPRSTKYPVPGMALSLRAAGTKWL
jgi:hypothetical protein